MRVGSSADFTSYFKRDFVGWRPRPESNRGAQICSLLRHHSATWPSKLRPLPETVTPARLRRRYGDVHLSQMRKRVQRSGPAGPAPRIEADMRVSALDALAVAAGLG
jgi:hypothetical protein